MNHFIFKLTFLLIASISLISFWWRLAAMRRSLPCPAWLGWLLENPYMEAVASAVMALTREVWVLQDRQVITEAILAERGIDIRDEIERFTPDEELQKELNRRGEILTDAVLRALAGMDREDT